MQGTPQLSVISKYRHICCEGEQHVERGGHVFEQRLDAPEIDIPVHALGTDVEVLVEVALDGHLVGFNISDEVID